MKLMLVRRRDGMGLVDADEGAFICRLDFGSPYGEKLMALEVAARALVGKLNEVMKNPNYLGVWTVAAIHGVKYDGPTWGKELAALEAVLGKETT